MTMAEKIFAGVTFDERTRWDLPTETCFDERLRFMVAGREGDRETGSLLHIIGFGVSGWQRGTAEVAEEIEPITDFGRLPKAMRTLNRQGKGVGPRLYNTPQALRGTEEDPQLIGAYIFTLDPQSVYDARRFLGDTHAGRVGRAIDYRRLQGVANQFSVKSAVEDVHSKQEKNGTIDAVLQAQTLDGWIKKRKRNAPASPIPERFMVIRRSLHRSILRVGLYDRQQVRS